jgi:hypothetical protein
MSANTAPIFVGVPTIDMCAFSTSNSNRDGTGTLATLATGTTNGKRIDRVVVEATGTTSAGMVRLFVYDGTSVYALQKEISVSAITPSGTTAAFSYEWVRTDGLPLLVLPSGYVLKVGTQNAEAFVATAHGGTY